MQFRIGTLTIGRRELIVTGSVVLLAVLILMLALIIGRGSADSSTSESSGSGLFPWATADELSVPDELRRGVEPSWYPSRAIEGGWSDTEVAEYWFDPAAIGIDVLDEEVENRMEALFSNVP